MPAEKLEHRTTHEDEDDLMEWQKKSIRPFITSLNGRNSDLMSELARESMAVTGTDTEKHPTSWLGPARPKAVHPFSANYEDRELNRSEADILLSYKATADSLDDTQQEFLSMTIRRGNVPTDPTARSPSTFPSRWRTTPSTTATTQYPTPSPTTP